MNYYPTHIGDYARDTRGLTLLEHGVYRTLLDCYYLEEGPLPLDLDELCALIGARTDEERAAVLSVTKRRRLFREEDGGLHQKRCDEEIEHYRRAKRAASENGKKGGRPVGWRKNPHVPRGTLPEIKDQVNSGNDQPSETKADLGGSKAEISQPKAHQEPRAKSQEPTNNNPSEDPPMPRKRGLPSDFEISDSIRAWASEKGVSNLDVHLEHFVTSCRARGAKYVDWDAAFRNAISANWARVGLNGSRPHLSAEAQREQTLALMREADA